MFNIKFIYLKLGHDPFLPHSFTSLLSNHVPVSSLTQVCTEIFSLGGGEEGGLTLRLYKFIFDFKNNVIRIML
jgi:hypothetical protein